MGRIPKLCEKFHNCVPKHGASCIKFASRNSAKIKVKLYHDDKRLTSYLFSAVSCPESNEMSLMITVCISM